MMQFLKKKSLIFEHIYLFLLGLYLFYMNTSFIDWNENFLIIYSYILLFVVLIRIIIEWWDFKIIIAVILTVCFYLKNYYFDDVNFFIVGLLMAGAININYKKVLCIQLIILFAFTLNKSLVFFSGIRHATMKLDDYIIRTGFACAHPNASSAYIMFILLGLWCLSKGIFEYIIPIIVVIMSFAIFYITRCNTVILCLLLLLCCSIYCIIQKKVLYKFKLYLNCRKILKWFLILIFPILFVLIYYIVLQYNEGIEWAYKLNDILHSRIKLGCDAYNRYESFAFGDNMQTYVDPVGYNSLDCGYLNTLYYGGWLFLIIYAIEWTYTIYKSHKENNLRIFFSFFIIAVYSIMETVAFWIDFNIFLVLFLCSFNKENKIVNCKNDSIKYYLKQILTLKCIVYIISFVLLMIILPYIFAYVKNIGYIYEHIGNSIHFWKYYIGFPLFFCTYICFTYFLAEFINCIIKKNMQSAWSKISLLFVVIIGIIASVTIISFNTIINNSINNNYKEQLEDEHNVMNLIVSNKIHNLYVEDAPVVYNKVFGGVSYHYFCNEDLARLNNNSVIMPLKVDSNIFKRYGYKVCEISKYHVLYTKDDNVINALRSNGYRVDDFYYLVNSVDLKRLAGINSLKLDDDGNVCLDGEKHSIYRGPYDSISYDGAFHMHIELETDDTNYYTDKVVSIKKYDIEKEVKVIDSLDMSINDFSDPNKLICRIYVFGNTRGDMRANYEVFPAHFDSDGKAVIDFDYWMPIWKNIMYVIEVEDNYRLKLKSMKYYRIN